ncbi:MAG: prepilin-type N-terminal cleavage/methylation domain-containing protein [Planctomycetota bacterium]
MYRSRSGISVIPRRALTLIELLVVLVILSALTGIAVQSIEPLADQARYESTQETLGNIQDAIVTLPPVRRGNGSLAINGFVSDMGRLPRDLDELLVQPAGVISFGVQTIASSSEGLPCGWRGPYLQTTTLPQTGWGTAFVAGFAVDPRDSTQMVLDTVQATEPGSGTVLALPSISLASRAYVDVSITFSSAPTAVSIFIPNPDGTSLTEISETTPSTLNVFSDIPVGVRLVEADLGSGLEYRYIDVTPGMASVPF